MCVCNGSLQSVNIKTQQSDQRGQGLKLFLTELDNWHEEGSADSETEHCADCIVHLKDNNCHFVGCLVNQEEPIPIFLI